MQLPDFQHRFLDYLLSADSSIDTEIDPAFQQRLTIYRNNVRVGLKAYLGDVFPAVKALVGEAFFNGLAQSHFQNRPPDNGNLHNYGEHFTDALASHPALTEMMYLVDVARLEWAYHQSFYSNHPPPRALVADLAQLANQTMALVPTAQLIHSPYPIDELWRQSSPGYQGEFNVQLTGGSVHLLVSRSRGGIEVDRLQPAEYQLLSHIQQGHSLEAAIETALTEAGANQLTAFLSRCITQPLLCPNE